MDVTTTEAGMITKHIRGAVVAFAVFATFQQAAFAGPNSGPGESPAVRAQNLGKIPPASRAKVGIDLLRETVLAPSSSAGGHGSPTRDAVSARMMLLIAEQQPDIATLRTLLRQETAPKLRSAISITACAAGDQTATIAVSQILTSGESPAEFKEAAAYALAKHPLAANVPPLVRALADPASLVTPVLSRTTRQIEGHRKFFYVRAAAAKALRAYDGSGLELGLEARKALASVVVEGELEP